MSNINCYVAENINHVDLSIYQYGSERCEPMHMFGPAIRQHYLLHYVIEGKGHFATDEKHYNLTAGQAFLICPNIVTSYFADEKYPWNYMWIEFDGLKAKEYLNQAGLDRDKPIYISNNNNSDVKKYLSHIIENPRESSLNMMGYMYLFLDSLIKTSINRKFTKTDDLKNFYVREALNYIERCYGTDMSIEDIANYCGLNRNYFSKLFKELINLSPQEFLMKYRMNKACELLLNEELLIGTIATSVGYPNQLHFSRAFKRVYNISPREWRMKNCPK